MRDSISLEALGKPPMPEGRVVRGLVLSVVLGLLLGGCTLPSLEGRSMTRALPLEQARDTTLGELVRDRVDRHPERSGIYPLSDAYEAFAARMLLAEAAEQTLDLQYYIWHNDTAGSLLFDAVRRAADRGVRVRLLLDDNNTVGLDETLAALDAHPGIEVRLFNPFVVRSPRAIGYVTDFSRANRRMHNKSFTIDNQVTIIGGRNVGDEYFGATSGVLFSDLDVMAIGPVVQDVSEDFDRYWHSQSSYPASRLLESVGREGLAQMAAEAEQARGLPSSQGYLAALEANGLVSGLVRGDLAFEWANTWMVSDDPSKGLGEAQEQELLTTRLGDLLGAPRRQLDLVSPYFVPMEEGTEWLAGLAEQGVRVRVLTNSLEATDVAAVHAGYSKRRRDLLDAGVELFELKRSGAMDVITHGSPFGRFGSSGSSLHAKTFAVDEEWVFIGSFNFDPRSARLNTEIGFLIESPALAKAMDDAFDNRVSEQSYRVKLADDGHLVWHEQTQEGNVVHDSEPNTGPLRRAAVKVMSWLPIEWLL
ncbi:MULTISPECIES: phospholipase D family protein [unclassified Halomonas]|uniref:phospholipase D family protein n=1 Tax=unclassified Halomonas TaxID=2609666 RepID=UPI002884BEFC|nr:MULTISPECIES: phospholipase D family protein [unclassified Halomonas]MDT0500455.1 phospholipase D family protein [Halomonas sp. PAR7]MDT0511649.1 phospholipase D family protein [Halomonas sp. LES1]MDT0590063.1 phospholipase D family protein [Halomonas sp. PAR8]